MRRLGKELEDLKKRRAALRTSLNSRPSKTPVSQSPGNVSFSLMFICFTFGVNGPFVNDFFLPFLCHV